MAIYDYLLAPDSQSSSRKNLETLGPLILIEVSATNSLVQLFNSLGTTVPNPIKGWGVIDTGAYTTAIDKHVLMTIGSNPIGTKQVNTAGTDRTLDVYPAKVSFPGTILTRSFEEVIGMENAIGTFRGLPIIGLIGREVLSECVLIYNGKTGIYTIAQ